MRGARQRPAIWSLIVRSRAAASTAPRRRHVTDRTARGSGQPARPLRRRPRPAGSASSTAWQGAQAPVVGRPARRACDSIRSADTPSTSAWCTLM